MIGVAHTVIKHEIDYRTSSVAKNQICHLKTNCRQLIKFPVVASTLLIAESL